jgi:tRNA nucleotidyltransferase/poly(A) polymerase
LTDPTGKKVSNERVKDEFYKGVKSAKSVKHFLDLIVEYGFFKHIFGNLNVDKNSFTEERHPLILMANLLRNNSIKKIANELNLLKHSGDEIKIIIFLISLLNITEDTISEIKKFYTSKAKHSNPKINEKNYPMSDNLIYEFAKSNNIDISKIDNFLRLANEFVQPSELLKTLGYQEKDLGVAISRLEKEFYKNPDKVKSALDSKNIDEINKIIFIRK